MNKMKKIVNKGTLFKLNDSHRLKFRDFCIWTHNIGRKNFTGAFKKWETNGYKLILNLHVLYGKNKIDDDIFDKAILLMKFYIKDWLKGFKLTEESEEFSLEKDLIDWFRQSKVLTNRKITQKHKYRRGNRPEMVRNILGSLVERGYVEKVITKTKGRESTNYTWADKI
jgi:hypothetical protein